MYEWCGRNKQARGAILPLETTWHLATTFYYGRMKEWWAPSTGSELQKILTNFRLTSRFWK